MKTARVCVDKKTKKRRKSSMIKLRESKRKRKGTSHPASRTNNRKRKQAAKIEITNDKDNIKKKKRQIALVVA